MSTEHKYEQFVTWAESQGVNINSVHLSKIRNQGLGVVASRNIEKDKQLVFIPARALFSFDSERLQSLDLGEEATVHGKLATCLTLWGDSSRSKEWHAVWPTREDFQSMPLVWPEFLQHNLPPAAKELLNKQKSKFEADWNVASNTVGITPTSRETFLYYWLVVNTRTFYWDSPGWKKRKPHVVKPPISKANRMALCPFGDCFNHADGGCNVTLSAKGFTITSDRNYEAGEELSVSYGAHSNDFLLTEYGFVLDSNKHDLLSLDTFLVPLLEPHRNLLEKAFFYGNYTLSSTGEPCFRTQVALRLLIDPPLSSAKWQRFANGLDDGEAEQSKVDSCLCDLLRKYLKEVKRTQDAMAVLPLNVPAVAKELLQKRWRQIGEIVGKGIDWLDGK